MANPRSRKLWSLAWSVALATCIGLPAGAASTSAPPEPVSIRGVARLETGWKFFKGEAPAGAQLPAFDDSGWQKVSVPHSWNRVGLYDAAAGIAAGSGTEDKYQGPGWYRLAFSLPPLADNQRIWLEFDAASRYAEVWLNGSRLGEHRGGFTRFRFDATAAFKPGKGNVLAVRVDNSPPTAGSRTADILPLAGDFFVEGGLYRPVRLIVTDAVHFDMQDFGGPGVYVTTLSVAESTALLSVRTRVGNDGKHGASLSLGLRLFDADGKEAARVVAPLSVGAGQFNESTQRMTVPFAHLWQGVDDPYLYRLQAEIYDADGRIIDAVVQDYGIRQIRIDASSGLFLNGRHVSLHGVGLHQYRMGHGWAQDSQDILSTLATLKDMGVNALRLTHYPHGEPIHQLADREGIILWDEIPLVTVWTQDGQSEPSAALVENAELQLKELIRQKFNHPSVAVWGIANEVDFGPDRPGASAAVRAAPPDPLPLLRRLSILARREDPTRPTTLATCCEALGRPGIPQVAGMTDVAGANRYFGWYYGTPDQLGPHLDELHKLHPGQPLAVTEYGAGGALSIHSDDPRGGPIDAGGRVQPEEYQAWLHEQSWPQLESRPYLWATWLWNGFDFATTERHEGDSSDINTKGLVAADNSVRKDAFYYYRANWSPEPTVHIVGRRYRDRAYGVTDVKVYSNAPATELTLNGQSLGAKKEEDCPYHVCTWQQVGLVVGANKLAATGKFADDKTAADDIEWTLAEGAKNAYRIDCGAIVAATSTEGRFGSDAFFSGGTAGTTDRRRDRRGPMVAAAIAGATDRDLLATYREGEFSYRLPLADGRYQVKLSFVEPTAAPGERVFSVRAEGKPVLEHFDVVATAGAPLTAVQREFPVAVEHGVLQLEFTPEAGQAIVSAIQVLPGT